MRGKCRAHDANIVLPVARKSLAACFTRSDINDDYYLEVYWGKDLLCRTNIKIQERMESKVTWLMISTIEPNQLRFRFGLKLLRTVNSTGAVRFPR